MEEGNQARSAMSSSMLDRLKKASADYEVRTRSFFALILTYNGGSRLPAGLCPLKTQACALYCAHRHHIEFISNATADHAASAWYLMVVL